MKKREQEAAVKTGKHGIFRRILSWFSCCQSDTQSENYPNQIQPKMSKGDISFVAKEICRAAIRAAGRGR